MAVPGLAPGIPGAEPGQSFNSYAGTSWGGVPQNDAEYAWQYQDYLQAEQYANQVQSTDTNANNPWSNSQNVQSIDHNSGFLPQNYFNPGSQVADYNVGAITQATSPQYTPSTPTTSTPSGTQASTPGAPSSQGSYPAMTNQYGLGSTPTPQGPAPGASPSLASPAPMAAAPTSNDQAVNSLTSAITDSGSKGMNPWSLQGESNARSGAPA